MVGGAAWATACPKTTGEIPTALRVPPNVWAAYKPSVRPIGSSLGKYRDANALVMTAAPGDRGADGSLNCACVNRSVSTKFLPRRNGTPSAAKYPGVTTVISAFH